VKKKIAAAIAATLWLPGFEPTATLADMMPAPANEAEVSEDDGITLIEDAAPAKPVWPNLLGEIVTGHKARLEANFQAVETLKRIEAEGRGATEDEARLLARFSGWGSFPKLFQFWIKGDPDRDRLLALLTQEEYDAAAGSVLNAHYTSPDVIRATWKAVERMGFTGGRVLEPSAGAGWFINAMPKHLAERSEVEAVELDPMPARIMRAIYSPYGVRVHNSGFEKVDFPDGHFDLVIGNVPFGRYVVNDLHGRWEKASIHNYFILRALAACRVGGVVAVITSPFTLEAHNPQWRMEMAKLGRLVAAFRLPGNAFEGVAGTGVTTDLLIFQRIKEDDADLTAPWINERKEVPEARKASSHIVVWENAYYSQNPENVLGLVDLGGTTSSAITVRHLGDWVAALDARINTLPEQIITARKVEVVAPQARRREVVDAKGQPGSYVILDDGRIGQIISGHQAEVVEFDKAKAERVRKLLEVRRALKALLVFQASSDDDAKLADFQADLTVAYDLFVQAHGPISKRGNASLIKDDPDYPLLLSLEHYDPDTGEAKKADVFTRRTVGMTAQEIQRCESVEEAVPLVLARCGRIDPVELGKALDMAPDQAVQAANEAGLVFHDPKRGEWVHAPLYLSGDVKTKLAEARWYAERDPRYAVNVKALEAVQPEDIPFEAIGLRLNSPWLPVKVVEQFCLRKIGAHDIDLNRDAKTRVWDVRRLGTSHLVEQTWGTERVKVKKLLEMALNGREAKVVDKIPGGKVVVNVTQTTAANERIQAIREAFVTWAKETPDVAEWLAREYNARLNRIVRTKYDGSHLLLPGYAGPALRPHQKDAIWRSLVSGRNTLLAHVVGAGKTLVMICTAMEMRRLGMANKPCLVVPNHMLEQVAAEFLRAYPLARVLMASDDAMSPAKRKGFLAKVATGDWDAVVMTHSSFERIRLPAEYVQQSIRNRIADMRLKAMMAKAEKSTRLVKELERRIKVWETRLERLAEGNGKDDGLDFAECGIDMLFVDEFHYFKNLWRPTALTLPGISGSDSIRAFDMEMKSEYVQKHRDDGRGLVAATATPVANSVAEMWVMQHYLQRETLQAMGIDEFDAWAATFGEAVTAMELAPDGSRYRVHTRFARFTNVPELLGIFSEVADVQTADMLKLPTPEVVREVVTAEPSERLKEYVQSLMARVDAIENREVEMHEDNMLLVTTDGRKAATDLRLCGIPEDAPGSKLNLLVENVHRIWQETASRKGTQLVFLDIGTPGGSSISLYDDIREKLVRRGVPKGEVAFIHEAKTDAAKERLFESVRAGKVRVLIGSTGKMGTGVNVQTRLVAIHHADVPWRPADVEQREGRGIRQGNLNATIRIIRYVTEGTFDAYIWQTLETKARFIGQVMQGDVGVRSIEDAELGALSYAEVKALASGNPLIIEKAGVDAEVARLSALKAAWANRRANTLVRLRTLPELIRREQARIEALQVDVKAAEALQGERLVMQVGDKVLTEFSAIGKRIVHAAYGLRPDQTARIGKIGAFEVLVVGGSLHQRPQVSLKGMGEYAIERLSDAPQGAAMQVRGLLRSLPERLEESKAALARSQQAKADLETAVMADFEHEQRLQALLKRKDELDAILMPRETVIDEMAEAA
jgi:N12 class adenine-specific DNA methylase